MRKYKTMDAFLQALPGLAENARDKLRGHDDLYCIELKNGERTYLRLEDGALTLSHESEEPPACIVRTDEEALLQLVNGEISPMRMLMFGGLHVTGDVKPLLRLAAIGM